MDIRAFSLGPLETNGYLAWSGTRALVVDPGGDPGEVIEFANSRGLTIEAVLLTHLHFDHLYGVRALAEATGAEVFAGDGDRQLLDTELGAGGFMHFPRVSPFAYTPIAPGPAEYIGLPCTVLATPGHTPGSLSFHFPACGCVFTGDLIFYRSVGRTDFPGGDQDTLLRSVRTAIFTLPPDTVLYPGHGPETSVGDEKKNNPYCGDFARD